MARQKAKSLGNSLADELALEFKAAIPGNDKLIRSALQAVIDPFDGDIELVKKNFSLIVSGAEAHAYEAYKQAETPAIAHSLKTVFSRHLPEGASGSAAVSLIAASSVALDKFFLSISQGRKSRAGKAVETFLDFLFRTLAYPVEREHVVNGTPDFVFPSVAHFRESATDCIIFTCKRTLRERWRQITSEGSRGFVLFLATLDAAVKANDLEEMKGQKIRLVVPEGTKLSAYSKHSHVMSFERFLEDHLDPAMTRWRRDGIIK